MFWTTVENVCPLNVSFAVLIFEYFFKIFYFKKNNSNSLSPLSLPSLWLSLFYFLPFSLTLSLWLTLSPFSLTLFTLFLAFFPSCSLSFTFSPFFLLSLSLSESLSPFAFTLHSIFTLFTLFHSISRSLSPSFLLTHSHFHSFFSYSLFPWLIFF